MIHFLHSRTTLNTGQLFWNVLELFLQEQYCYMHLQKASSTMMKLEARPKPTSKVHLDLPPSKRNALNCLTVKVKFSQVMVMKKKLDLNPLDLMQLFLYFQGAQKVCDKGGRSL